MRAFVSDLIASGDVAIVEREVDPRFELAAVTAAAQRTGERAILFRRVKGSRMEVVTNLYGSRRRLCDLIGAPQGRFCRRWTEIMRSAPLAESEREVKAEIEVGRLGDLPVVTYFEKDAGPYITAGIFLAKDPETGVPNLSFHRSMMVSDSELRVRLGTSHDLKRYYDLAAAAGKPLEAAILIGAPPPVFLAAAAPIPYHESEMEVAARLAGAPLAVRRCNTIDLAVPAETEIVIEGRFLPNRFAPEGPFGEFMGYYVPVGDNNVFEITEVSWRKDPMYHALLCGSPEDLRTLELAVATRIYQAVSNKLPGILDVACVPMIMNAVIQIEQRYEGHGRHALMAAIGADPDFCKTCMVVDDDVDINDLDDVWWAFLTRARADKGSIVIPDVPGFYRDPMKDHWGRLAIDATKPWGRHAEFERKRIPGEREVRLEDYLRGV